MRAADRADTFRGSHVSERPMLDYRGVRPTARPKVRWVFLYLPAVVLIGVAVILPTGGRDVVSRMNWRELALFLGFWWMAVAIVWRVGTGLFRSPRGG